MTVPVKDQSVLYFLMILFDNIQECEKENKEISLSKFLKFNLLLNKKQ